MALVKQGLDPLPPTEGARTICSLDMNVDGWPYVARCGSDAVGLLSEADYARLRGDGVNLNGRAVCKRHGADLLSL